MPPCCSSRIASRVSVLSHLAACPKCGYYVGVPVMCKGQSNPTKKGFWFEKVHFCLLSMPTLYLTCHIKCLNNEQPAPDTCTYFKWQMDITRRKSTDRGGPKKSECPGPLCSQSGRRNPINVECTFGVCVKCCRHLQPELPTMRACSVSDHRKGVVYPSTTGEMSIIDDRLSWGAQY